MPRKASCICGSCPKCKVRIKSKVRYDAMTIEERRAWVARRDANRVRADDRARHQSRKNDPDYAQRRAARHAVNRAVARGELERGECELAGLECSGPIEGHHDDYSRPLEVRWLCKRHHDVLTFDLSPQREENTA
jgi:hypothetical protein